MSHYNDCDLDTIYLAYKEAYYRRDMEMLNYLTGVLQKIGVNLLRHRSRKELDNRRSSDTMKARTNRDYGVPGMKWGVRKGDYSEEDLGYLKKYKSSESYNVNAKLRDGGYDSLSQEDKAFVDGLDKALKKAPTYNGPLCRDLAFSNESDLDDFLAQHKQNGKVVYNAYTSFSKEPGYNPDANVTVLIKNSAKGRDIEGIGLNEREVLYERGSVFDVVDVKKVNGKWFVLESERNE